MLDIIVVVLSIISTISDAVPGVQFLRLVTFLCTPNPLTLNHAPHILERNAQAWKVLTSKIQGQ